MTAEWKCTVCRVTNRRIVAPDARRAQDRCVTCRTRHVIEPDERPPFWRATAAA